MKVLKIIKTSLVLAIALAVVGNDVALATYLKNFGAVQPHEIPGYDDNAGWHKRRGRPIQVEQPVIHRGPNIDQRVRQEPKTSCSMNALKTAGNCALTVLKAPVTVPKAVLRFAWNHKKEVFLALIVAGAAYAGHVHGRATAPTKSSCGSHEDQSALVGNLKSQLALAKADHGYCALQLEEFITPVEVVWYKPWTWNGGRQHCENSCRTYFNQVG